MILNVNHKIDKGEEILRKLALILTFCIIFTANSYAQMPYIDEVRALGAVAGQGLACGAAKYNTFEMLARAILISKAPTDDMQAKGMYAYNEEKANAYFSKQMDGFYECELINRRFNAQDIFKATLYADGTIKMPDGNIVTPRKPYDASLIYDKKNNESTKAQAIYSGNKAETPKDLRIEDSSEILGASQAGSFIPAYTPPEDNRVRPVEDLPESTVGHIRRSYH